MNKTIASISAFAVLGGSSLSAQWVPTAAELSVTSDITFASEYVFRGVEAADHSFQPSVEVSMGDFYAGLWTNLPTGDGLTEIQYYGGLSVAVPDFPELVLDVGFTVNHWPDQSLRRSHEAFLGTKVRDFGVEGVSASLYYFYDFDVRSHVVEGSVGYSFPLEEFGLAASLDASATYGLQSGSSIKGGLDNPIRVARVQENYHYYGFSLEMPFHLNQNSTVTGGVHYYTAEKLNGDWGRGQNLFWTISYTAGF